MEAVSFLHASSLGVSLLFISAAVSIGIDGGVNTLVEHVYKYSRLRIEQQIRA
jgi:hypothetical protein